MRKLLGIYVGLLLAGMGGCVRTYAIAGENVQQSAYHPQVGQNRTAVRHAVVTVLKMRATHHIATLSVGSSLAFELTQDLILDGRLVAKAGDVAKGYIQGKPHDGRRKNLELRFSIDTLQNYCGSTIRTEFTHTEELSAHSIWSRHPHLNNAHQRYQVLLEPGQMLCSTPTNERATHVPDDAIVGDNDWSVF